METATYPPTVSAVHKTGMQTMNLALAVLGSPAWGGKQRPHSPAISGPQKRRRGKITAWPMLTVARFANLIQSAFPQHECITLPCWAPKNGEALNGSMTTATTGTAERR